MLLLVRSATPARDLFRAVWICGAFERCGCKSPTSPAGGGGISRPGCQSPKQDPGDPYTTAWCGWKIWRLILFENPCEKNPSSACKLWPGEEQRGLVGEVRTCSPPSQNNGRSLCQTLSLCRAVLCAHDEVHTQADASPGNRMLL